MRAVLRLTGTAIWLRRLTDRDRRARYKMLKTRRNRRLSKIAAMTVAALGLVAVALPLHTAKADMVYLGWDFGNGYGVGVGTVPSAYGYHYCGFVATRGPCYGW
jgi:hypothetical protein